MALADYIAHKPVISTARLILRPMTAADVPALREWLPNPAVYTYWGKGASKAEKMPELLFEKAEKQTKSFHLGIALRSAGKVIGDLWIYLIENDRMASAAIRLSPAYQSQGLGTEALSAMVRFVFSHTELKRIHAEADVRNIASQKMLEKSGFTREGMIRQGKMVNSWCDYFIYGILNTDDLPELQFDVTLDKAPVRTDV